MSGDGYRSFLKERSISAGAIDAAVALIEQFESHLRIEIQVRTAETATADDAKAFSEQLISDGGNSFGNYLALLRYSAFIRNRELYATILGLLDGAEAFGNLYTKLANVLGEAKRDAFFEGVIVPPLGTPNEKKPALVQRVLNRLETDDAEACKRILSTGLRDLHDEWYQDAVTQYASCRGIDEYLAKKSKSFLAEMERHKKEGKWWFVQEITDAVIAHVRQHPMMSSGIREGNIVYEVKIPYMAKEWLEETDPQMRGYYACHCPWVRESLRTGDITISPTLCNCSAAFHKRPWEIIFGKPLRAEVIQSVLHGDSQCKFAIHLPEDVA